MEESESIRDLFRKYLNDAYSEAELDRILQYFHYARADAGLTRLIEEELDKTPGLDEKLVNSMGQRVADRLFLQTRPKTISWVRRYLPYAAAILCLITAGVFLYQSQRDDAGIAVHQRQADALILPGGNRATLRLDNGNVLTLNEDQESIINKDNALIYGDGSAIEVLEHTQRITLMTPRAGQYAVTLSDGTKVWLNAASELVYPAHFDASERSVELKGEAYFEVAHDAERPFVVETDRQRIRVLGTRFNVHAYANEQRQHTTLMQGAVMIESLSDATRLRLKPGQQAVSEADDPLALLQVNPEEFVSWKDGIIMLNGYTLPEIILQLERWYDVEFDPIPAHVAPDRVFGMLNRDVPLNDVLKSLEESYNIHFTITGRRVMMRQN